MLTSRLSPWRRWGKRRLLEAGEEREMAGDGQRKETVGNPPRDAKARGVRKLPALHANVALEMEASGRTRVSGVRAPQRLSQFCQQSVGIK